MMAARFVQKSQKRFASKWKSMCKDYDERKKSGDFLAKMIAEKRVYSAHEWDGIKRAAIGDGGVTEVGFGGYMMTILFCENNLIGAKSLLEFLEMRDTKPSAKILTQFLLLCAQNERKNENQNDAENENPNDAENENPNDAKNENQKEILYDSYKKLEGLYPSYVATTDFCSLALANTDQWREMIGLLERSEKLGRPPTRRYDLLVQTALAKGQLELGLAVLRRMAREKRFPSARTVLAWFELCEHDESRMDEFISYLQNSRMTLTYDLAERIKIHYEKKGFGAKFVNMQSHYGYCSGCKKNLEQLLLDETEFKALSAAIVSMVQTGENKFLKCEFESELDAFKTFVEQTGPYDFILDATSILNCNIEKAEFSNLVEHLTNRRKQNVLIFGKKCLKLAKSTTTKCHFFSTQSLWTDDAFILYAAFSSGWQTSVVTRHLWMNSNYVFRDDYQLFHLFSKWRACKQIPLRTNNGRIELLQPRNVNPALQRTDSGLHVPFSTRSDTDIVKSLSSNWLCLYTK